MVKPRDRALLITLRGTRSQREIAKAIGISYGHYGDIERGARNPSYDVGDRLAKLHNTTVEALFEATALDFGPIEASA